MEFLQARSGRCNCEEDQEEDQEVIIGNMGKLPFSSSSSSSPSSSHYKGFFPHHHELSQRWGAQIYESASSCDPAGPLNFGINSNKKPDHELIDLSTTSATNTTTNSHTRAESDGDIGGAVCIEREHMFDKVVTPSDVGKLNRLVIPKQQAEKYFPLDSTSNEKGLLLNFEDRSGKPWRFRYSYWNSSQSYVMTKGWSRFVKEKKLYAGDIVSFERGAGELGKDRLYIDWRRRPDHISGTLPPLHHHHQPIPLGRFFFPATVPVPYREQQLQQQTSGTYCGYNGYNLVNQGSGGPVLYLGSSTGVVEQQEGDHKQVPIVFESVPVVHGKAAAAKRLRLFGVNMECPISEDEVLSSTTIPHTTMASSHHHHQIISSNSLAHHHHPLQLRLYNGAPGQAAAATVSEATHIDQLPRINREPSMSLDLDI